MDGANCKNANTLGFTVESAQRIDLARTVPWPQLPSGQSGEFRDRHLPAASAHLYGVDPANLVGGRRQVVLDFDLPPTVRCGPPASLAIKNIGAVNEASCWPPCACGRTPTPPVSPATNPRRPPYVPGGVWSVSGLATLIPPGGRRFFITVDLATAYAAGGELRFQVPVAA